MHSTHQAGVLGETFCKHPEVDRVLEPTTVATSPRPLIGDRSLFPSLAAKAYLNHAAISPLCEPAQLAVQRALRNYAAHGAGAFPRWEADRNALREELAQFIGAEPSEIAFGSNTTRGVTDIALSIPWKKGDRVVLFEGEFPANVSPWQRAAELFELELCFLDARDFETDSGLDRLEQELRRGVRLVAVSFVQFQTGLCMPLAEMGRSCERHGSELFVDLIQGVGVMPLDVHEMKIHYASSGAHKWLLGSEGAGFVYVKRACAPNLRPYTAGWLSHEESLSFLFEGAGNLRYDRPLRKDAAVFEGATNSLLSLAALRASLSVLRQLDLSDVLAHVQRYHDALEPHLVARGFVSRRPSGASRRSGILSTIPPQAVPLPLLARRLRERGVVVATPDGHLRFAPHFANSLDEVDTVIAALDESLVALRD